MDRHANRRYGTNSIRSRQNKSKTTTESSDESEHLIINADEFKSYSKENFIGLLPRHKHNSTQITFMILTTVLYVLEAIRAYIPKFWLTLATRPITRVYTFDLRPTSLIEGLLYRLTENWQAFCLIYMSSYILRRTALGYLYRNPNIFSSLFCSLLIGGLIFRIISQFSSSSDISLLSLYLSLIILMFACRLIAVKLFLYERQYKSTSLSIDLAIVRYVILNSLFLYTTLVAYTTLCATIECYGIYRDLDATFPVSISICTTIGLLMITAFLFIYVVLDQFIYKNEFSSIWTPYLCIAYIFLSSPSRPLTFIETDDQSNELNYYFYWLLCWADLFIIFIRLCRQLYTRYRQTTMTILPNLNTKRNTSKKAMR